MGIFIDGEGLVFLDDLVFAWGGVKDIFTNNMHELLRKLRNESMRGFHAQRVESTLLASPGNEKTKELPQSLPGTKCANCSLWESALQKVMRTILRKTENGLYFEGPDKWTGDPHRAFNFKSIDRALRFIEKFHLHDIEIAFAFNDRPDVTGVPLERMVLRYSEEG